MKYYNVQTADCVEDVEEGCYDRVERGLFTAEQALDLLERGNGGTMREVDGPGFCVSHIKSENDWLRKELKL